MQDEPVHDIPPSLAKIVEDGDALGFAMASEPKTGALLKTLAASKPRGKFLELGTGTGLSAAWILQGMDRHSRLVSVDNDARAQAVAKRHLGEDVRIELVCADGAQWLQENRNRRFDLIFADAWPGKFRHLELTLDLLSAGGLYLIDDLLPQDSWPEGHAQRVPELMETIENLRGFTSLRLAWATGLMIVVKQASS